MPRVVAWLLVVGLLASLTKVDDEGSILFVGAAVASGLGLIWWALTHSRDIPNEEE